MFSPKQQEKYKRTRYTRELERFLNRLVNRISNDETLEKEAFGEFVDRIFKPLEGIEKVLLNSNYLKALEQFVEKSANLPQSDMDMEEIRKEILHGANQLQKIKRLQNRQGRKHKGKYDD